MHTHTYTYTRTLVGVRVWGYSYARKCGLLWCKVEAGDVNDLVYLDQRYTYIIIVCFSATVVCV